MDKETVIQAARKSCTSVKETLNKKPIDTTNNTVNFLNGVSEDDLKNTRIKDRILVITWAKKVVGKHQHLEIIQDKIDIIQHHVKMFMVIYTIL